MSCTVSLLPVILIYSVINAAIGSANTLADMANENAQSLNNQLDLNSDFVPQDIVNIICREYETVFMDKDLLVKTLEEHGATNFEYFENKILCKVEDFAIELTKDEENKPYMMNVTCDCKKDIRETLDDINTEYGMNVQEESYIKLKERLEEKNMKIEEEEVLDDNTIVLTVNLD